MPKTIQAKDIMAKKLVTLRPEMDVVDAIEVLLRYGISGAPVLDEGGRFVGIFTERSCMDVVISGAMQRLPGGNVEAFMLRDVRTVTPDTDLFSIAQIFFVSHLRRLPVLDGETLVGQVSRRDVLRAMHKRLRGEKRRDSSPLYLSATGESSQLPR